MSKKHTLLERKPGLYLKDTGIKGRGLFCVSNIKSGEVLEVTPAVILNDVATEVVDKTILADYVFEIGKVSKRVRTGAHIKDVEHCSNVIMGIMSFCNHTEEPNTEIVWEEIDGTLYYTLQATQAIPKHTEICTTYGDTWFDDRR